MKMTPVSKLSPIQQKLIEKVTSQFNALRIELNDLFPGREHLIEATIQAMIAGENVFIYGRPGTAKTLYMETVINSLSSARVFRIIINAQTPPSHLIGAQILKKLDEGIVDFNVEESLVSCDVAWIDEYPNANPMTATSLNTILHERSFVHGTKYYPARLGFTMVAGNLKPDEYSTDPRVQANLDRFMFKYFAGDVTSKEEKIEMYAGSLGGRSGYQTKTRIEISDLQAFQNIIKDLNFIGDPILLSAYFDLVEKLETIFACDYTSRSETKILQILEVIALTDGQSEVLLNDFPSLRYAFTDNSRPDAEELFEKAVTEIIKKYDNQAGKQIDSAELALIDQLSAQVPSVTKQSTADELLIAYRKISDIKKLMVAIKPTLQPTSKKLEELQGKVADREKKIEGYMQGI